MNQEFSKISPYTFKMKFQHNERKQLIRCDMEQKTELWTPQRQEKNKADGRKKDSTSFLPTIYSIAIACQSAMAKSVL